MQSSKALIVAVSILLLSVLPQPVRAFTFDYHTKANALVLVNSGLDIQTKEANNVRSYARAYYDDPLFGDNVEISALADASVEPNEVVLSGEITGSYEFGYGWKTTIQSFYQDANGIVEGLLRIDEFPTGTPCSLQIDISFPNETWDGLWLWQLYIESSSSYFNADCNDLDEDNPIRSGTLDIYAGEEIYVFLGIAGRGYADLDTEALGDGKLTINATLTATRKVMTKAYNPTPADGSIYNDTRVSFGWWPGDTAASHDVYFGSSLDDVNVGTNGTFQGNQAAMSFIAGSPESPYPDGLVPGTTYYWRIDEVETDGAKHKGDIWSFQILPRTACYPDPADGAEFVELDATLSWTAGLGAELHFLYFGDNFDDVNNASGVPSQGSTTYTPDLLEAEKVYYWRVDENDGHTTYKGDVWGFTTPGAAGSLQPANGAVDVQMNSILNWTPAATAVSHDVYFGTDKDAVKNATTASPEYKGNKARGVESYDPGKLSLQSDYYWRIDAIYNTGTVKGLVWSFTTADFIKVDDFEDYNDYSPNDIFSTWKDGYDIETNGALIGYDNPNFKAGEHFVETTIVHSGDQSMPYFYNNIGAANYSEAGRALDGSGRDFTAGGVAELSLWFRGYPAYVGSFAEAPMGTYTMTASGANISGKSDQFHYAFKTLTGVGSITARVMSVQDTDVWAKAGVMIRETLDPGSKHAFACVTPGNGVASQGRNTTNDISFSTKQDRITAPCWVKLERSIAGNFTVSHSANGSSWQPITGATPKEIRMSSTVYIGLALTSHNTARTCEAVFTNVTTTGNVSGQWTNQDIGIASNDAEPLYVAVSNTIGDPAVVYHDDPNAAQIDTWTEWVIPLQEFSEQGVDLTDVDWIAIGFGIKDDMTTSGSGTMYFDDIRLQRPAEQPQP
jgi:hypothetical protein